MNAYGGQSLSPIAKESGLVRPWPAPFGGTDPLQESVDLPHSRRDATSKRVS